MRSQSIVLRLHRFTGAALCAVFAVWFASGVVMTFAGYPHVSEAERLKAAEPLTVLDAARPPAEMKSPLPANASLVQRLGRPMYTWTARGKRRAHWADTDQAVAPLSPAEARRTLGEAVRYVETLPRGDQWTVAHAADWPLHHFVHAGPLGRESYVSAVTGELVQRSDFSERVLAWLGAIPHWVYPAVLRRQRGLWRALVLGLSALGCMVCLSGLLRGLGLVRRRRSGGGLRSPFQDSVLRLHHLLGLGFGLLTLSWTFSGMLSLSPFSWSQGGYPSDEEQRAFRGGRAASRFQVRPEDAVTRCNQSFAETSSGTREVHLVELGGRAHYLCLASPTRTRIVSAEDPRGAVLAQFPFELLSKATRALLRQKPEREALVYAPDDYYYGSHGQAALRLPYYRASLGERDVYVDAQRGSLLYVHTPNSRLTRWLYHGLHSWDFPALYRRRGVWQTSVIVAMVVGFALSASAVYLTLRRYHRWRARRRRRRAAAAAATSLGLRKAYTAPLKRS